MGKNDRKKLTPSTTAGLPVDVAEDADAVAELEAVAVAADESVAAVESDEPGTREKLR